MIYITASGAATIAGAAAGIHIQVNTALTGTITVTDGGVTVAVITNPIAGNSFHYYGFKGAAVVNPSATCDITVNVLSSMRY